MSATIADIARMTGKDRSTVSRALRGDTRYPVSEASRRAILEAARKLDYAPSHSARSLASGKSYTVGAALNRAEQDLGSPHFAAVLMEMNRVLLEAGYHLTLLPTDSDQPGADEVIDMIRCRRIDGLYIGSNMLTENVARELATHRMPVVTTEHVPESAKGGLVSVVRRNDRPGMQALGEMLARRGHRRVAYVIPQHIVDNPNYAHRVPLFHEAMAEAKIPQRDDAIVTYTPTVRSNLADRAEARLAAEQRMDHLRRFSAIVGTSDLVALGVGDALCAAGLEPGRDVALAGYDNIEASPSYPVTSPFLTTIDPSRKRRGRQIGELLLAQMREPDADPRVCEVPSRLIVRRSLSEARAV